eukprot:3291516-Rhodomonas_salina.1
MARAYDVPIDRVATFDVEMQLTQQEACLPEAQLQTAILSTLDDYLTGDVISKLETVTITKMSIDKAGVSCDATAGVSCDATAGVSCDATAIVTVLVVFDKGTTAQVNLERLSAMPGINSFVAAEVSARVDTSPTSDANVTNTTPSPAGVAEQKLEATATLAGMSAALFDAAAENIFKEQVAALLPGKVGSDVTVTGKREVARRRQCGGGDRCSKHDRGEEGGAGGEPSGRQQVQRPHRHFHRVQELASRRKPNASRLREWVGERERLREWVGESELGAARVAGGRRGLQWRRVGRVCRSSPAAAHSAQAQTGSLRLSFARPKPQRSERADSGCDTEHVQQETRREAPKVLNAPHTSFTQGTHPTRY